jgi:hypothetical protein
LNFDDSPGNLREEPDSRREISGCIVVRDYAPAPRALILGRTTVLRVVILGAKYLFFFTTGENA